MRTLRRYPVPQSPVVNGSDGIGDGGGMDMDGSDHGPVITPGPPTIRKPLTCKDRRPSNRSKIIQAAADPDLFAYARASLFGDVTSGLAVGSLIMADSGATRTRRWKLHKAGNHSECKGCDVLKGTAAAPGHRETPEGPVDAQALLERQARRLEAACESQPGNAALEKELRATLLALRGPGEGADDELAEFDAAFSAA
jgi:hypothetical protein